MDNETPSRMDGRQDNHRKQLEKSEDVGSCPHVLDSRNDDVTRCWTLLWIGFGGPILLFKELGTSGVMDLRVRVDGSRLDV
jgi:hypothetical protein